MPTFEQFLCPDGVATDGIAPDGVAPDGVAQSKIYGKIIDCEINFYRVSFK